MQPGQGSLHMVPAEKSHRYSACLDNLASHGPVFADKSITVRDEDGFPDCESTVSKLKNRSHPPLGRAPLRQLRYASAG